MSEVIEQEKEPPPQDAALHELDQLMESQRRAHASQMAGSKELKWQMLGALFPFLLVGAGPFLFDAYSSTLICYYSAIVGFVVAAWGLVSALRAKSRGYPETRTVYAGVFAILFIIHVLLFSSPHLGKQWGLVGIGAKPPVTKKTTGKVQR